MPTFEHLVMAAPAGFIQSCSDLNNLANGEPAVLASFVSRSLTTANLVASDSAEAQQSHIIKAVNFIVRSYKSASPQPTFPQMAATLDQHTMLTRECVEKIIVAIQGNGAEESAVVPLLSQVTPRQRHGWSFVAKFLIFPILLFVTTTQLSGKMQNFKWRVGVAVSSSKCKNLSSPYVLVSFDVRELDGAVTQHSCELSYDQFQVRHAIHPR
jgi:hypothetical protein